MSKSTITPNKPLKGVALNLSSASIGDLNTDNLKISPDNLQSLMDGLNLNNVTITNSEIINSIIGSDGSNDGFFNNLTTYNNVVLYNLDKSKSVTWDPNTSILTVNGAFTVDGCATIGNISICTNNIRSINNNGNINLIPNGFGGIYLTGPVSNIVPFGNFLSVLNDGNVTFISSDYINLTSLSSSSSITSFSDQNYSTYNGNINLNTETGISTKLITSIIQTDGNLRITSGLPSGVRVNDIVNIIGSNSFPNIDGEYPVTGIVNSNSFLISTGSTFGLISTGNYGTFLKDINNSINLNASLYVKIPTDIPLIFGNTSNSIYGNTSNLYIKGINDIIFSAGNLIVPQSTDIQLGTSANNSVNFNGSSFNINSNKDIIVNTTSDYYLNADDILMSDPNPFISNYTQYNGDISDRGVQFRYWSGSSSGSSKVGWFGYKQSSGKFTFLTDATNTNEIMSGVLGTFDIGTINVSNLTLNTGGIFDVNCGQVRNVNLITGCSGTVNINGSTNVNISTGTRLSLMSSGDIFIPNNIPITLGTAGTSIREGTLGNLILTGSKNILFGTQTNGSLVIQPNTKLSFDGSTVGNQSIFSDTSGNIFINSNKNVNIKITSGNLILGSSTSSTSNSIQFGDSLTEYIYASTNGMYIVSKSSVGNLNLISTSDVNISNSNGNILINPKNGDINLYTTQGNVRLYQNSRIIFSINGTNNSIRSDSVGNLIINGPGTSNIIEMRNTGQINLSASTSVNIPTNVQLNVSSNNDRYIRTDTNGNFNIINNVTSGNINVNSTNLNVFNTGGSTNIVNNNTNITTNTLNINGVNGYINIPDIYIKDQIPLLANYSQSSSDLTDRGLQYNWYNTNTSSGDLGWFGVKQNTGQFTFYKNAVNNNDIISGTLGTFALGSINVSNNITFLTTGNLDMTCGTISNLNTILGCRGVVNILATSAMNVSTTNLMLNATGIVQMPFATPLAFGNTTNSISVTSNGNMTILSDNGTGTVIFNSNVQINGTTNNVFSTITNYQDPIISIGGITGPLVNDFKDRGIEFKWHNGTTANTGFFGFQNSTQRFVFFTNDVNTNEIISGTFGSVQFANGFFNNLDVNCGTIANVSLLTACSSSGLAITGSEINLSASNILIPNNSTLSFGNTSNSISSTSSGNLNIISTLNTNITSISGGINLITNTNGTGFVGISQNSPLYFGNTSSNNYLQRNTSGDFYIVNSTGNIFLSPITNTASSTGGYVTIPTNNTLVLGNTSTSMISDGQNLTINGYTVSINTTGPITFNGDVNIIGSISALSSAISNDAYIYPLGTQQILAITNIQPSSTTGLLNITTNSQNYLSIGDTAIISNTTNGDADGTFIVQTIVSPTTFTITHAPVTDNTGTMTSKLVYYQGKSVGIEVDYWQNNTGNGVTSGTAYYHTGFFGVQPNTNIFTYYADANIVNNVVINGTLGNMQLNKLITNKISGFALEGTLSGDTYIISGTNFQIGGGNIDNTLIGQTIAQSGRFTQLSSTINSSLSNVTLQSQLNYSIERFSVSSLVPSYNPSNNRVVSFISVTGTNITGSGNMSISGYADGQVKKLIVSSMGSDCTYVLNFVSGTLITPNPLGGSDPTKLTFKRRGQSVELTFDAVLGAFIISGGTGAYTS